MNKLEAMLEEMCCLCLCASSPITVPFKNLFANIDNGPTYFNKISSSLSQLAKIIDENATCSYNLCYKCCETIDTVYKFNNTCLGNVASYLEYSKIAKEQDQRCTPKFDLCEDQSWRKNDDILVKTEPEFSVTSGNDETQSPIPVQVLVKEEIDIESNFTDSYLNEENMETEPNDFLEDIEFRDKHKQSLIPEKSRKLYEACFDKFVKWAEDNNFSEYSEEILIEYFQNLSKTLKSSTLWSTYSMIKALLNLKHNHNIEGYKKLTGFLKMKNIGYEPKKSKILTKAQCDRFLYNAPDEIYLVTKLILIFGICGACRCDDLVRITIDDIDDLQKILLVKIRNPKNKYYSFTIDNEFYINLYRRYRALRPKQTSTTRFFMKYLNGRCHNVVVGIHKIAHVPKEVAAYLKLPDAKLYTGTSFRKTTTSVLSENGEEIGRKRRKKLRSHRHISLTDETKILQNSNLPSTSATEYIVDDFDYEESSNSVAEIVE